MDQNRHPPPDRGSFGGEAPRKFEIFRAQNARTVDAEIMPPSGFTDTDNAGMASALAAGFEHAAETKLLYEDPVSNVSITYTWLKGGFRVPRHSHSADCWYYIISGELQVGTEALRAGDGFFVAADHLYTFAVDAAGAEVLEFRNATQFNLALSGNNAGYWDALAQASRERSEIWKTQARPEAAKRFPRSDNYSPVKTIHG